MSVLHITRDFTTGDLIDAATGDPLTAEQADAVTARQAALTEDHR